MPVNASSFLEHRHRSSVQGVHGQCHRIWCSNQLHWLLAFLMVLLAMGLKCWLSKSQKVEGEVKRQESPRDLATDQGESAPTARLLTAGDDQTDGSPSKSKAAPFSFFGRRSGAVAPGDDGAVNRSGNSRDEVLANSENSTTSKEVEEGKVDPEKKSLLKEKEDESKESKEIQHIQLPAAGDKYPLGLARHLGLFWSPPMLFLSQLQMGETLGAINMSHTQPSKVPSLKPCGAGTSLRQGCGSASLFLSLGIYLGVSW